MTSGLIREVRRRLAPFPVLGRMARRGYVAALNTWLETGAALQFLLAMANTRGDESRSVWEAALPLQPRSRVKLPLDAEALRPEALQEVCARRGLACGVGGDALYLPPATWASSPLSALQRRYPERCGIKISRADGGAEQPYMTARFGRHMARRLSYPHIKQLLTYNFLHASGLAPRLYDLLEIETADGELRVCYVVEDVVGEELADGDCEDIVTRLRDLETDGLLRLISAAGWSGIDFQKPDGNGNIIRSSVRQRPLYVDIHNFILPGYKTFLDEAWRAADTSVTSVPGLTADSRDVYTRLFGKQIAASAEGTAFAEAGLRLLAAARLPIAGRVVFTWRPGSHPLDPSEMLRRGAQWLHAVVEVERLAEAERLLLALGCTRFSLSPLPDQQGIAAMAAHLHENGEAGTLLHYRPHKDAGDWAAAALALPWTYMLYEYRGESERLSAQLDALADRVPVRLLGSEPLPGGLRGTGAVALIERM